MSGRHDDDHLHDDGNRGGLPADIGMTGLETEL